MQRSNQFLRVFCPSKLFSLKSGKWQRNSCCKRLGLPLGGHSDSNASQTVIQCLHFLGISSTQRWNSTFHKPLSPKHYLWRFNFLFFNFLRSLSQISSELHFPTTHFIVNCTIFQSSTPTMSLLFEYFDKFGASRDIIVWFLRCPSNVFARKRGCVELLEYFWKSWMNSGVRVCAFHDVNLEGRTCQH